jgi:hypothetical protein
MEREAEWVNRAEMKANRLQLTSSKHKAPKRQENRRLLFARCTSPAFLFYSEYIYYSTWYLRVYT